VHGFPTKFNLPFHQAALPSLSDVPLVSDTRPVQPSPKPPSVRKAAPSDTHDFLIDLEPDPAPASEPVAQNSDSDSHSQPPSSDSARRVSLPSSHTSHDISHVASAPKPTFIPPVAASAVVGGSPPQAAPVDDCPWAEFEWEKNQPSNLPKLIIGSWDQTQNAGRLEETHARPSETLSHPLPVKPRTGPSLSAPWGSGSPRQNSQKQSLKQRQTQRPAISRPARGPKSIDGGWDDLFADVSDVSSAPAPARVALPPSPPCSDIKASEPTSSAPVPEPMKFNQVAINKHGERLDIPLPALPEDSSSSINRARGLCNQHHLNGTCSNSKCHFTHGEVDEVTILALRHLARNIPCPVGRRCRRAACTLGHHCRHRPGRRGSGSSGSGVSGGGSSVGARCKQVQCMAQTWRRVTDFEIAEIVE
jgi:hypothetical protein